MTIQYLNIAIQRGMLNIYSSSEYLFTIKDDFTYNITELLNYLELV